MRFQRIGRLGLAAACIAGFGATGARAHFLWLRVQPVEGKPAVHAFLAEQPVPEGPEFLKFVEQASFSVAGEPVGREKGEETYVLDLSGPMPLVVDGERDLGVMTRGDATFRLRYTARVQTRPLGEDEAGPEKGDQLRVRLVAGSSKPWVEVAFEGQPAAGAVVKAYREDGTSEELKADERGRLEVPGVAEGATCLLAKWADGKPGELEGKEYPETRYYATLTIAEPDGASARADGDHREAEALAAAGVAPFALLPEPINSFGGAVLGDWLYVYSGHTGTTHRYHTGTTSPHFGRLNLVDRTTWEELPCGPAVQGVSLVEHGGKLYRTGGMTARNAEGEDQDLVSTADAACFDPATKTWSPLPDLPSPRSTHDGIVCDGFLYVVGGWNMTGGDASNAEFCEEAYRLDLRSADSRWEALPQPPFRRRALAVMAHSGKVYVIGGLNDEGGTETTVDIFDPAAGSWSKGPDLPGPKMQGFAPSAYDIEGRLYASGSNGVLLRMSEDGSRWDSIGAFAMPRITHRLLPGPGRSVLAVGGNFAGEPVRLIERIGLDDPTDGPRTVAWSVPFRGDARQSQAVALVRGRLIAAGGNRTQEPHSFGEENLVAETQRFSLGGMMGETVDPLPTVLQSSTLVNVGRGREARAYLIGGIGPDGDVSRTLDVVYQFDAARAEWTKLEAELTDSRGMFGVAAQGDTIYVFGGSIFDPRPGQPKRPMPLEVLSWDTSSEGSSFEPTGATLPRARRSFAGAAIDGKYYLVGGLGEGLKLVDQVDVFDLETREWTTAPAPDEPRLFADMVALGGKLYLAGGVVKSEGSHFEPARSVEVYDPATRSWSTLMEEAPVPVEELHLLTVQDRLLFFGMDPDSPGLAHFALSTTGGKSR